MKKSRIKIQKVDQGSIAEELDIEQGDIILSINGEKINDIFDYRFLITNEIVILELEKKDGEIWEIEIEKDEYEDLGIDFENSMIDEAMSCSNKCIFCFIDQLPENMRETLYFKDDDSRLSFLEGNYVTLTNMNSFDIDRIIKYRMSPINISIHTTNPDLRVFMLRNKSAGDALEKVKKLVEAGIKVNCQIVLCRHINDGKELDRTISDLAEIYPGITSISVVPVGITKHRKGLTDLDPFDAESSIKVIEQMKEWQRKFFQAYDSRIVFLADEFYIMAGYNIPEFEHYEDFPQIENGVGLLSSLRYEFYESLKTFSLNSDSDSKRQISIATGVSAYKYIKDMAEFLEKINSFLKISVYEIKNDFFGENVTVTGLLTGGDLVQQLKGRELGSELLISRCMLKSGEELFLDDYTVKRLKEQLNVKIIIVENTGRDFISKVLGKDI